MQYEFLTPPAVPGFALAPDLIDPSEERALIALIDGAAVTPFRFQGWEGRRLTASYGPSYDFERGRVEDGGPLPEPFLPLRERMAAFAGITPDALVQLLLIRYDPGAGIGWHRDRPQFGTVVGLSLGAPAVLRLRRRRHEGGFDRASAPLDPRGAYRLDGEVREAWEHSIAPLENTRWSITFRSLSDLGRRSLGA